MKEDIALFVDYENIRKCLQKDYKKDANPAEIAKALKTSIEEFGEMKKGYVFGDWAISHSFGSKQVRTDRAFEREGFTPVMVSTKPNGQDRTDSRMNIDAFECLLTSKNISAFAIVSGDGDFAYLCRRIKGEGKRVIICSFTHTVSPELLATANPFVAVENILNLNVGVIKEKKTVYDWKTVIEQLVKAEQTLPFVGFKQFRDKWLSPDMGPIDAPEQRHRLVNEAIKAGIVEVYKEKNPGGGGYDTSAISLNLENPLVQKSLSPELTTYLQEKDKKRRESRI
jgi:uncharacterized protein (TIGR00288 family)